MVPEIEAAIFFVIVFYFITTKCFCLERGTEEGENKC